MPRIAANTLQPPRIHRIVVPVMFGKRTLDVRTSGSITRMAITAEVKMFNHFLFTHGPSTCVSFYRSNRNTTAVGSRSPAQV